MTMKKIVLIGLLLVVAGVLSVSAIQKNKKKTKKKAAYSRVANTDAIGNNANSELSISDNQKQSLSPPSTLNPGILEDLVDNEAKHIAPKAVPPLEDSKVVYDRKSFTQEQWDKINGSKIIK